VSETLFRYESAKGWITVTSYGDRNSVFHGMSLSPSGRLVSERRRPAGSLVKRMLANGKAVQIGSFMAPSFAIPPEASVHVWPRVYESTTPRQDHKDIGGACTHWHPTRVANGNSDDLVVDAKNTLRDWQDMQPFAALSSDDTPASRARMKSSFKLSQNCFQR